MTRMSGTQYIKKIKAQRAEQYQKTRELKVVMAKAVLHLSKHEPFSALTILTDALGLPLRSTSKELELLIAQMQRAEQDEGEKDGKS